VEFTELIGDLVQLARDETTSIPVLLDFRNVVNAALDRVRLRAHGLLFDVELNPFYVAGDSDMLERAVTNLLDNAVKWSPPGGTIRVQLEGDRLRVADQGPGISEVDMPFIFDRFFRGRPPGPVSVSRSLPRQSPSTEAGSAPVVQRRVGLSSPFICPEQPASRSSPSLRNLGDRLRHRPLPRRLPLPPPLLRPHPPAPLLPKLVANNRVEQTLTGCSQIPTPSSPALQRVTSPPHFLGLYVLPLFLALHRKLLQSSERTARHSAGVD
jgi:hypothetical protein